MEQPPKLKRRSNLLDTVTVLGVVLLAVVGFLYWNSKTPQSVIIADNGFKKAKASINPEEWRSWALELLKEKSNSRKIYETMPDSIRTLYSQPPDVRIEVDCVVISWGGGFFNWQINIGATNYSEKTGIDRMFTTVEWVPGIYYSREGTRHPFQ